MKANISDLKKIVKVEDGNGTPLQGTQKPPKNVEGFEDEKDKKDSGDNGEDQEQDQGQGQKSGKDQKPGQGGDEEYDDEFGDGEGDEEGENGENKPQKGSGQDSGTGREFKEIDPISPGEYKYEEAPWSPPKDRTVVGEVLPTGTLGDGEKGADSEEVSDKWKQSTTAAESQAQGKIPGGIKRALERMRTSVVDWKEALRKFIDEAVSKSRYVVPSRRFLGRGDIQYGRKNYNEDFGCVVVAIDTSGSISDKMVAQFLGEVQGIVDAYSPQDLYIIFCHTRAYRIDHLSPGDPINVGALQSGGTEFYPPFKWVEENLIDKGITPSCFIYFTDGEATFPKVSDYSISQYDEKAIWVLLTFNGEKFPYPVPFGDRIDITLANKGIKEI